MQRAASERACIDGNWELSPRESIIRKKRTLQRGAGGVSSRAEATAINTSPGPATISSTVPLLRCALCPRIMNTTMPANKEVAEFTTDTNNT